MSADEEPSSTEAADYNCRAGSEVVRRKRLSKMTTLE